MSNLEFEDLFCIRLSKDNYTVTCEVTILILNK